MSALPLLPVELEPTSGLCHFIFCLFRPLRVSSDHFRASAARPLSPVSDHSRPVGTVCPGELRGFEFFGGYRSKNGHFSATPGCLLGQ
jgi:hypothetical protein